MSDESFNDLICGRMRRKRMEIGLSVSQAARRAGIPQGSFSCLESGRYRLNLENLFRLLTAFDTDISEIWPRPSQPLGNEAVTSRFVQRLVSAEIDRDKRRIPALGDVLNAVCHCYGITRRELSGPKRSRFLSEARTAAALIVKECRFLTLSALSIELKRDVSSLSHSLRRARQDLRLHQAVRRMIVCIQQRLREGD